MTPPLLYLETYGCQMNESDSLIVQSLCREKGLVFTEDIADADWILLNTCAVRENAQDRIFSRVKHIRQHGKKNAVIGLLGCMAQNLQEKLLDHDPKIQLIAGPDSYRQIPDFLTQWQPLTKPGLFTKLNKEEQYHGIALPQNNSVSSFVTIMRGCNNFCSFCVVPFTRGRERSLSPREIKKQIQSQIQKSNNHQSQEITLLGQNVNSYQYKVQHTAQDSTNNDNHSNKSFFEKQIFTFTELIEYIATQFPSVRIRFTSPHPKDFPEQLLRTMAQYKNIMPQIHLPLQSGSDFILQQMRREYTLRQYLDLVDKIRHYLPAVYLSTDIIFGFPGETDEHASLTLNAMAQINFHSAFIFKYSQREHTLAQKQLTDNVPDQIKSDRVTQAVSEQQARSLHHNRQLIGQTVQVLAEGPSKKNPTDFMGKTIWGHTAVFPQKDTMAGDLVNVQITQATSATLIGRIVDSPVPGLNQ